MTNLKDVQNIETLDLEATPLYAAILGSHPSKGARSPLLWNNAFAGLHINARMYPMDVSLESLPTVIEELKADKRCIGGAVTTPHKQAIGPLLDEIEEEANLIGSVNALYRDGEKLVGANTDGAAALKSLETHAGSIAGKTILLLGLGGAGQAVAIYLARALGQTGKLILCNRTLQTAQVVQKKTHPWCPTTVLPWPANKETLALVDILVNSTTLGFDGSGQEDLLPIADTLIPFFPSNTFVFDLIYQPPETPLLKRARTQGLQTLNGKEMNLEQAVIAFEHAVKNLGQIIPEGQIKSLMQSI